MDVCFTIGHPSHVYFFQYCAQKLTLGGHRITVIHRSSPLIGRLVHLLSPWRTLSYANPRNALVKPLTLFPQALRLLQGLRGNPPNVFLGCGQPYAAFLSAVLDRPCIQFTDAEHAWKGRLLFLPFTDVISTSNEFGKELGRKHRRFQGIDEMAYLSPDYFTPDSSVLDVLGCGPNEYVVLRLGEWGALHDSGQGGFYFASENELREFMRELEGIGRVFVTAEGQAPAAVRGQLLRTDPTKIHSVLHYAALYVGEGAAMATEAAVLGVPAVYCSTIGLGYMVPLLRRGLLARCVGWREALRLCRSMAGSKGDVVFQRGHAELLRESIDLVKYQLSLIEEHVADEGTNVSSRELGHGICSELTPSAER